MAETRKLVIVGDSLFAEIAHEYFTHDSPYEVVAFSVESEFKKRDSFRDLPLVDFEALQEDYDPSEHDVYVALVYTQVNRARARLAAAAKEKGFGLASYVSSNAFVWRNVELGEHCFIFENNTLQPFVRVGDNVVMWAGNHIGHHSTVRDNVFIASHVVISGSCEIGANSFLGVNSTVVNDITLGEDCWIGPHVVLTKDVEAGSMYRPARSDRREQTTLEFFELDS
jgi:sugar O-acyltransferase (sialic acid O-acetyltransferase NeuD family)